MVLKYRIRKRKKSNTDWGTHCPQGTLVNGFLYIQQGSRCTKNNLMREVVPRLLPMTLCSLLTGSRVNRATEE